MCDRWGEWEVPILCVQKRKEKTKMVLAFVNYTTAADAVFLESTESKDTNILMVLRIVGKLSTKFSASSFFQLHKITSHNAQPENNRA